MKLKLKNRSLTSILFACIFALMGCLSIEAQPSSTYYNSIEGKTTSSLKTELYKIIKGHHDVGYDGLYTVYQKSDVRSDGKVWDMYSNTTNFNFGQKCGTYKAEGNCFNREHSFPQSWFGSGTPKSDAFQVIPTDGYVNNRRGNVPLANVGTTTYTSNNGFSKLGTCSDPGYSGKVFEPNDEYKGDFARMYFYMATRYEDNIAGWKSKSTEAAHVLAGNSYPAYQSWYIEVLLKWHRQDPVSQKEIDRNNAIFNYQNNRNPFIDYPILAEFIWGDYMLQDFHVANTELYKNVYDGETIGEGGGGSTGTTTYKLYYNANNGSNAPSTQSVEAGGNVTVSSETPYRSNYSFVFWNTKTDGSGTSYNPGDVITLTSNLTLYAIWAFNGTGTVGTGDWVKVTEAPSDWSGEYLIVCEEEGFAFDGSLSSLDAAGNTITVSISKGVIASSPTVDASSFTIASVKGGYTVKSSSGFYIGTTSSSNGLLSSNTTSYAHELSMSGTNVAVKSVEGKNYLRFNNSSGQKRFRYYGSEQRDIQLYRRSVSTLAETHTITLSAPHNTLLVFADGALLTGDNGVYTTHESAAIYIAAEREEGYVTESWSKTPSTLEAEVADDGSYLSFTMPDEDVTFSATVRAALQYTVTLLVDGETYADALLYEYDTMGEAMGQADAPEKEGYEFLGWAYDVTGEEMAESDDVLIDHLLGGALNLYAIYAKLPIVTFIADNDVLSSSIASDHALALPSKNPEAEGYVFVGWTSDTEVSSDGIGILYAEEGEEVYEDATYRAVFAKQEGEACVELLTENFAALTEGTISSPSGTLWSGNSNFTSIDKVYPAGGVVKLGSNSGSGSMKSKVLATTAGSLLSIQFKVKGWTSVEGQIKVSVTGCADQTVSYNARRTEDFETKRISFTLTQDNPIVTIATTSKRAFLDDIQITTGGGLVSSDYTFHPSLITGILGDANGDGVVDVSDVTLVVSYVLGSLEEGSKFVFEQANAATSVAGADETIDVSDITAIVAIILGKEN